MKKIIVDKTEGIAEVIDKLLNEPDKEITLVIPRGSALGRSARNFHLLKREADSAGREVTIESVDETILAYAKENKIDASHPLWRGVRGQGEMSDIVPRSGASAEHERGRDEESDSEEEVAEDEPKEDEAEEESRRERSRGKKGVHVTVRDDSRHKAKGDKEGKEDEEEIMEEEEERERAEERRESYVKSFGDDDENKGGSKKVLWWILGAVVVLGILFFALSTVFAHANVTINFKQTPWTYQNNITADKSATAINAAGTVIPAQIFTSDKNTTLSFPASSFANVSTKAQGSITVYNAYSSASQELVATTRFLTPDGKIYRLVKTITVPGAQVSGSTITPSSIVAQVVADQPGPDYNTAATSTHLSVPGFQNTARYNGFYGVITGDITGGATGRRAVPTAADIAAAKASTTAALQGALSSNLTTSYPNNFKILDGATTVQLTKITVNTSTDDNGNFSVFAEGTVQAIGFDEGALKDSLLAQAQSTESSSTFSSITLNYSGVTANFNKGQVSFSLNVQSELEPAFVPSTFVDSILGKSISEARESILALPQLKDGQISVWPLWLWSIPGNASKVHITTQ